jgi:hypothetical protein
MTALARKTQLLDELTLQVRSGAATDVASILQTLTAPIGRHRVPETRLFLTPAPQIFAHGPMPV